MRYELGRNSMVHVHVGFTIANVILDGAVTAIVAANVWEIIQLLTLISPQLYIGFSLFFLTKNCLKKV